MYTSEVKPCNIRKIHMQCMLVSKTSMLMIMAQLSFCVQGYNHGTYGIVQMNYVSKTILNLFYSYRGIFDYYEETVKSIIYSKNLNMQISTYTMPKKVTQMQLLWGCQKYNKVSNFNNNLYGDLYCLYQGAEMNYNSPA